MRREIAEIETRAAIPLMLGGFPTVRDLFTHT